MWPSGCKGLVNTDQWHISHIVESCPLTKLNGGLSRLHSADEDAVSWLTNYGKWHAYEKKKKWHIQRGRGGATARSWSDRKLLDNLCTVFVSFVLRLYRKIRGSSLLITVTFLGESIPFHHTTPPSTPTVPRRLSTEILNTPLYSPIYLSGMYFVIILTVSQIQTLQLPSLSWNKSY